MKRQKNTFQMKEQDKATEEELSEEEIGNLPNKEFKVMIIMIIKETERRLDEQTEKLDVCNKELENIKKNQTEMKNSITEMKIHEKESTVE